MRLVVLLLATGLALPPTACRPQSTDSPADELTSRLQSELPVSRVVLYRSGIAYVERRGEVESNLVTIPIRPDQINDILGSLTVIVDGGQNLATSIGLPIERTVARELDRLPPQVSQQGGMLALLQAFRGARVELSTELEECIGRVVGTEALTNDEGNQIRRVTVMTDEGELRQFRVDDIQEVRLLNETLTVGLAKSLDVSLGEGDWKPVELTLRLTGDAPHTVFVSYVVEMPTWKPTYRVLIDDDRVHLQGWAVVDNVSGEDWREIDLSLVAGTPISFRYDLHSPRFVNRPDLTWRGFRDEISLLAPEVERGVRSGMSNSAPGFAPPAPEGRWETGEEDETSLGGLGRDGGGGRGAEPSNRARRSNIQGDDGEVFDALQTQTLVDSMAQSVRSEQLDNLFRYDISENVTVSDRGSALVTIINEPVEGEDVLYFDPSSPSAEAANTPYRAIRLVNTSTFTIERGPLSIVKDSTFVGQAISPRIGPHELIFLPYSLDGRYLVSERQSTGEEGVRLVRIVNSVIYSEVQQISRRTYQVTNNAGETARLYVRVPKRTNWSLRTPDPEEAGVVDQGEVWFVPIDVPDQPSTEFVVEEVTTVTRTVAIWDSLAADTIGLYLSTPGANPELAATLQQVLDQRNRIADVERELARLRRLRTEVYQRMNEVRQNLEILGDSRQSRELRSELESRLGDLETQATDYTVQVVSLEEEESELRARINTTLMDLSLEPAAPEPEADGDE